MKNKISYTGLEVAVIGMTCKFPESENIDAFWQNIKKGNDCVKFYSEEEILESGVPINQVKKTNYVKSNGGEVANRFGFDAEFFNYTLDEALLMDPHIRLMHEGVYNALINAGYPKNTIENKIGLFIGSSPNVQWEVLGNVSSAYKKLGPWSAAHFLNKDFGATLISYKLGLTGPSVNVSTACSTSLVSIHMAARSILLGECEMAVAGGASLNLSKNKGYLFEEGMVTSPDGRCRAFDFDARGTVPGEGVGMIVLKSLKKAIDDGDQIHAIIKGSAINNDGDRKNSFTAPSIKGQVDVIKSALNFSKITPESIGYVETHGTGTKLGDPVEIKALSKAYQIQQGQHCSIGALKSSIGHLDAAAGVAGFIKTVLVLKNKIIPPLVNFKAPNPLLEIQNSPFKLSATGHEWHTQDIRRAAVSSFGIGGTNAHVILEEYVDGSDSLEKTKNEKILILSAQNKEALDKFKKELHATIKAGEKIDLADLTYTLQVGRDHMRYREGIVFENRTELLDVLDQNSFKRGIGFKSRYKVYFSFPGQGTQYLNMGRELFTSENCFRETLLKCFRILKNLTGTNFETLLFSKKDDGKIDETINCQPILFSVQYALAKLLESWDIHPAGFLGHSIGEYTAACLANVFSLEDALKIVSKRAAFMQEMEKGDMLAVHSNWKSLLKIKSKNISFASINGANHCVVSGPSKDIRSLEEELSEKKITTKKLKTSHAFHSSMMTRAAARLEQEIQSIKLHKPTIPFVSNVTGTWINEQECKSPEYWSNQLKSTVQLHKGITTLLQEKDSVTIELGQENTLNSLVKNHEDFTKNHRVVSMIRHRNASLTKTYASPKNILLQLWLNGVSFEWKNHVLGEPGKIISLPGYSFVHKNFELDQQILTNLLKGNVSSGVEVKNDIEKWFYVPTWKKMVSPLEISNETGLTVVIGENKNLLEKICNVVQKKENTSLSVLFISDTSELNETYNWKTIHSNDALGYISFFEYLNQETKRLTIIDTTYLKDINRKKDKISTDNLHHFLYMAKGLKRLTKPLNIFYKCITVDNYMVIGSETLSQNNSFVSASLKVLSQELFHITSTNLDFDSNALKDIDLFAVAVYKESCHIMEQSLVVVRNGQNRWIPTFEQIGLPAFKASKHRHTNTHYLLTGGLGSVGFTVAKALTEMGAIVTILGRTSFKEKDLSEKNKIKYDRLKVLQEIQPKNTYLSADVCDLKRLKNAVAKCIAEVGPIHGVFHLAASEMNSTDKQLLENATIETCEKHFKPKIVGTENLKTVFSEIPPEFVVLFSSISTVLGGVGYFAYAAANAFMDRFVQMENAKQKNKTQWIGLNWDGWQMDDSSQESLSIHREEGAFIMNNMIHWKSHKQLIISTHSLDERIKKWVTRDSKSEEYENQESIELDRPELSAEIEMPSNQLEEGLQDVWKDLFGYNIIGINDDFYELGGDSLKALQLINAIRSKLQKDISIIDFFRNPTIKGVAALIQVSSYNFTTIPKAASKDFYLLSSAQKRLYFLQAFDNKSLVYNSPKILRIKGDLNQDALDNTFKSLIARHESFRTSIQMVDAVPMQKIEKEVEFEMIHYKASLAESKKLIGDFIRPFNLAETPLLRVGLIALDKEDFILIIDMHHIVTDGISHGILIHEFMSFYKGGIIDDLKLQYKDYSEWQNAPQQKLDLKKQQAFWAKKFETLPPLLELPVDFKRPLITSYHGALENFQLSEAESSSLKNIAKEEGCTMFMVLLSVFNILLQKLSNTEDIVLGVPIAGRPHSDLDAIIGMFVNTLPLRNEVKGSLTYTEFLKSLKENTLEAFENQLVQYEDLVSSLDVNRDLNRNPLFDVSFSYENFENVELELPNLSIEMFENDHATAKFDLTFTIIENDNLLYLGFEYSTDLFKSETIKTYYEYLREIIAQVTKDRSKSLSEITILPKIERDKLLYHFNETSVDFPDNETIITLFEKQVAETPEAVAIDCQERQWTYQEVHDKSNQLANYIKGKHSVHPEDFVGIKLERDAYLIVSILAVLKCGAAYVPIDVNYPKKRIEYIENDSKSKLIINDDILNEFKITEKNIPKQAESIKIHASQVAYVIYTSGTTGRPKGVMVTHKGVSELIQWAGTTFDSSKFSCIYAMTSQCFDLSVFEMFYPLSIGKKMRLLDSALEIGNYLNSDENILLNTVPSVVKRMIDEAVDMRSVSMINMAGEPIPIDLINALPLGDIEVRNLYGPTEDTIYSTSYTFSNRPYNNMPIGKPISNTRAYILNEYLEPQPVGVIGELYLSGSGLAKGYLNNPELTALSFIENPFVEGTKMYRTGDLVKWLPDKNIEFVGRRDDQVKIRGYRIELSEIEHYLKTNENIKEAKVIALKDAFNQEELTAFIVFNKEQNVADLQRFLSHNIPGYMIPGTFISIEVMPLNANGKIDKNALQKMNAESLTTGVEFIAPRNATEEKLVIIWKEVLQKETIGIKDNFFALGGHSLKAVQLILKIQKEFNVTIELKEIFMEPTIEGISLYFDSIDVLDAENFTISDTDGELIF